MAEALGIVGSVIGIIQLTGQVLTLGYGYMGGVNDASRNARQLVDELFSLTSALHVLQNYVRDDKTLKFTALQALNGQNGPLPGCALELKRLQLKLEPKAGWRGKMQSLAWPLKEKETLEHISRIERHKNLFTLALTTDQMVLSKEIETYVKNTNDLIRAESTVLASWMQKQDNNERTEWRDEILKWLYPGNFDLKHLEISSRRQAGTGKWLFRTPGFKNWIKTQPHFLLLLGHGIPGAGKTFLSSTVIDHLLAQAPASNHGVGYIYFDFMDREQQRPIHVLSSLVKQLAIQGSFAEVKLLFDKLKREEKRPTFDDLYTTLIATSKSFSQTFLVFDALDECDQDNQRKYLLPFFHRLAKDGISVFLTSRPYPEDIQISLNPSIVQRIELSAQEDDIGIYIEQRIDDNPRAKRLVRQGNCRDKIISSLVDCAKGMFLLVRFHIENICQQPTIRAVLRELEKLNHSSSSAVQWPLDPTYDRAMDILRKQPSSSAELGLTILSWLSKAKRTLTTDELRVAVSVEQNRYELDEWDLPDDTTLLDVCASLITIDENSGVIRLAHYTIQEYLLRKHIPDNADFRLAMACTTYLSFDIFAHTPVRTIDTPFLWYAARHFISHLKACDEALTTDIILKVLENCQIFIQYQYLFKDIMILKGLHTQHQLLIATIIGNPSVLRLLLEKGADTSVRDISGIGALYLAVTENNVEIVQLLLDHGADTSIQGSWGCTALHEAVSKGNVEIVRLLLDKGADTSIQKVLWGTALHEAVSKGNVEIVRLFLDKGADTSIQDSWGCTALRKAVHGGRLEIARLLLDKGADTSIQDSWGCTALHEAVSKGNVEIVRLLLDKGADTSIHRTLWGTALHEAVSKGNVEIARLLLDKGADTSIQDRWGCTALHKAVHGGRLEIARLFLDKGTDTSIQNRFGGTVLHHAAPNYVSNYNLKALQLSSDHGVSPSLANKNGQTVLESSVYRTIEEPREILAGATHKKSIGLATGPDDSIPGHVGTGSERKRRWIVGQADNSGLSPKRPRTE